MSRVRIEIFDGDFEDAPAYTRESTAETEGDGLHEAFERAVAMARAALPARPSTSEELRAAWESTQTPPARCWARCPVRNGHLGGQDRCCRWSGHSADHENIAGCRWSDSGMGGHTPDGH